LAKRKFPWELLCATTDGDDLTRSLWRNEKGQFKMLIEFHGEFVEEEIYMNLNCLVGVAMADENVALLTEVSLGFKVSQ
jgi:hypothetical protein